MDDSKFSEFEDEPLMEDPLAGLERMFIEEYLKEKGYNWCELTDLDPHEVKKLMTEACMHAMAKLANIEAKGDFYGKIRYKKVP